MASPPLAPTATLPEDEAELDHGEAWEAEIGRRIEEVRSGQVQLIAWEEVQAEIETMLGRRPRRVAAR